MHIKVQGPPLASLGLDLLVCVWPDGTRVKFTDHCPGLMLLPDQDLTSWLAEYAEAHGCNILFEGEPHDPA